MVLMKDAPRFVAVYIFDHCTNLPCVNGEDD